mmetsp:Transcript_33944/g.101293  ORF Transcript_33944/g.101293 Transcript_33944/m.101293 type:complete len:335 (+) Transcript_33944:1189-2193(+)
MIRVACAPFARVSQPQIMPKFVNLHSHPIRIAALKGRHLPSYIGPRRAAPESAVGDYVHDLGKVILGQVRMYGLEQTIRIIFDVILHVNAVHTLNSNTEVHLHDTIYDGCVCYSGIGAFADCVFARRLVDQLVAGAILHLTPGIDSVTVHSENVIGDLLRSVTIRAIAGLGVQDEEGAGPREGGEAAAPTTLVVSFHQRPLVVAADGSVAVVDVAVAVAVSIISLVDLFLLYHGAPLDLELAPAVLPQPAAVLPQPAAVLPQPAVADAAVAAGLRDEDAGQAVFDVIVETVGYALELVGDSLDAVLILRVHVAHHHGPVGLAGRVGRVHHVRLN